MAKAKPMTKSDASRIQSTEAQANGGAVAKGSFAARAQSAADRAAADPAGWPSTTGNDSGKGRDNNPPKQ